MVTQKLFRHEQIVERMRSWELQYLRVMLGYWRDRACEAERRLSRTGRAIGRSRLGLLERAQMLSVVRGIGGGEVSEGESD